MTRATMGTPTPAWRVHVDVRGGVPVARPADSVEQAVEDLLAAGVPLCVIDLDGSRIGGGSRRLLADLVRTHPDLLWVGGGVGGADEVNRWLDRGAHGVMIGSALFRGGRIHTAELRNVATTCPTDRVTVSIDARDGRLVTNGFDRPTGIDLDSAFDAVAGELGDGARVLYADAGASLEQRRPDWTALARLADRHPNLDLWYGGNLECWADIDRVCELGFSAVIGRCFMQVEYGLPLSPADDRPVMLRPHADGPTLRAEPSDHGNIPT